MASLTHIDYILIPEQTHPEHVPELSVPEQDVPELSVREQVIIDQSPATNTILELEIATNDQPSSSNLHCFKQETT